MDGLNALPGLPYQCGHILMRRRASIFLILGAGINLAQRLDVDATAQNILQLFKRMGVPKEVQRVRQVSAHRIVKLPQLLRRGLLS